MGDNWDEDKDEEKEGEKGDKENIFSNTVNSEVSFLSDNFGSHGNITKIYQ